MRGTGHHGVEAGCFNCGGVTITGVVWTGLRCSITVSRASAGMTVYVRTKAGNAATSLVTPKAVQTGAASLLVANDDQVIAAACRKPAAGGRQPHPLRQRDQRPRRQRDQPHGQRLAQAALPRPARWRSATRTWPGPWSWRWSAAAGPGVGYQPGRGGRSCRPLSHRRQRRARRRRTHRQLSRVRPVPREYQVR